MEDFSKDTYGKKTCHEDTPKYSQHLGYLPPCH